MMKAIKRTFKPFIVILAIIGLGFIAIVKRSVFMFKPATRYQMLVNLDNVTQKLYRVIFNPYRVSNGMRPRNMKKDYSFSDVQKHHELLVAARNMA